MTVIREMEFKALPELCSIQIESHDGSDENGTMRWFPAEQEAVLAQRRLIVS